MGDDRVFVLVVNLDSEEFLDAFGRPHFDGIPGHAFANVDADFATDALVESDLNIWNHDIYAVRRIAWGVFNTIHGTEADTGFTTGAVIRDDNRNLLWLLLLT